MVIKSISSKDSDEIPIIRAKNHNIEIKIGNETHEIIEELFKSLLKKYQEGLKKKIKGSEFLFLIVLIYCIIIFIKYV